jgi:acyl-CoA thioesterase-2
MLEKLLDILTLRPAGEDAFIGANMHPAAIRVYGGQVLAQAVSAAISTVEADRAIHSQHAYFLRPGDATRDIEYQVERARDGGSFSSRRVVALQGGKPILVSSMSFQEASRGEDFQPTMPEVPAPESLVNDRRTPLDWNDPKPQMPPLQAWVKTNGRVGNERALHQALLAYFSDVYLIDACLMIHGRPYTDPGLQVASLDHALWFHDDFRADDWLLLTMDVEWVGGGRGLARGRFFTRDGQMVATAMQEGLMRLT